MKIIANGRGFMIIDGKGNAYGTGLSHWSKNTMLAITYPTRKQALAVLKELE